jgi:hypothetical protein
LILHLGVSKHPLKPLFDEAPSNVREIFHIDKIQGMVAKYSSDPFEVTVEFPKRDEQYFPVIIIPTGIKTPVAAKSDFSSNGKILIRVDTVYVRSLSSNNTPSTTQAKSKDWNRLTEVCFDNREADIGRFIRRHLGSIGADQLNSLATVFNKNLKPEVSNEDLLREYIQESEQHYEQALIDRADTLPEHGAWEVGLILQGEVPHHATNQEFLNLLNSSNPGYTGRPVWQSNRKLGNENYPYVIDGGWEELLIFLKGGLSNYIDFMRLHPRGKFFLRRALQDDMGNTNRSPQALTTLDFSLTIEQTAEAIAVGIAFAKAMGCLPEETALAFAFKWTKLKGRKISSWARSNFGRSIPSIYSAYQDEVITFANVPLDMPLSAISQYVNQTVKPLFEIFGGFTLSEDSIEGITRKLIERR